MVFAKDEESAEALLLCYSHKSFGDRVLIGPPGSYSHRLYALALEHLTKVASELRVRIMNDVIGRLFQFAEEHAQIASHLLHPLVIRVGRHPQNMDLPCLQVDEEQHIVVHPATHGQHGLGEEITGPERRGVTAQEVGTGVVRIAGRLRLEAVVAQDPIDRGPPNRTVAQSVQLTLDPPGAPAGLLSDPEHQFPDLLGLAIAAHLSLRLGGLFLRFGLGLLLGLHPAQERAGCDDGNQALDLGPEPPADLQELVPLGLGCLDSLGQPIPEDLVLDLQVLHILRQLRLGRIGDQYQQRVHEPLHVAIILRIAPGNEE